MHDIKWIRENPDAFDREMERRGIAPVAKVILDLDRQKREGQSQLQELQARANDLAKQIGMLKSKGENADAVLAESKKIKEKIATLKEQAENDGEENDPVHQYLVTLPNLLDKTVPFGAGEEENTEIRRWGEPAVPDFEAKQHFDIGEALGLMDFEQTAKISGARFVTLMGSLARLERALAQFMLDVLTTEYGHTEMSVPHLVRAEALFGTSQLPKFEEDQFRANTGHYLIPTAEVPLTNMVREMILGEEELPLRMTAHTSCYRSEAGAAGKDTRGMIRQHQFRKVEMVSITTPEQSAEEHERMTAAAEEILQRLELPYRVMVLCSGDTGFGSRKTYDLEVWLPGQHCYREISSCSQFGDFQARRMRARCRKRGQKETRFVHTLNGSGVAVGRALVAVLENYQNADGSVTVPKALLPYMQGITRIENNMQVNPVRLQASA